MITKYNFHHFLVNFLLLNVTRVFGCYPAIYSFGNSLADTGNLVFFEGSKEPASRLPYGQTYFHYPTGRYSDGRLVVDFIAEAFGLPFLLPYPARNTSGNDFKHGADFAVTGANALSNEFFKSIGINVTSKDYSFATQLQWFKQLLPSIPDRNHTLSNSLFLIGELGVNDYGQLIFSGSSSDVKTIVPAVIKEIGSGVNELINFGAKTVVITGMLPLGCTPIYLTLFQSPNTTSYDQNTYCLKWWNSFTKYHNKQLKHMINQLKKLHPETTIIYADYYAPIMDIIRHPEKFGVKDALKACCGGSGPYNFNLTVPCGDPSSTLCDNPSNYVSWDGLHLTEKTYEIIANGMLDGEYANPPLNPNCKQNDGHFIS